MRYSKLAILAGAFAFVACGGGGDDQSQTPPDSTPAAAAPTAGPAPITGTTHVVQMVITEAGEYKFIPAEITIPAGDGLKFEFISGGPHNVAFAPEQFASRPDAKAALIRNMPEQMLELSGKMLNAPGESYTISFGGVPAGTYEANCTPHIAMGMKMNITVQ